MLRKITDNIKSYLDPRQVGYVIFYVTNRCNFRCAFCFYGAEIEKGKKPDELTVDEIRRLAPQIGPLVQLSLTGGEPFLRKEFAEITRILIQHCRPRFVTIPTNASLTERMMTYLEDILPSFPDTFFRLSFSIEGIEEQHDKLRSKPGSFKKIRESYAAISPLRQKYGNLTLDANSVFTADSETTLLDTMKYLASEFTFDNLSITYARGKVKNPELMKVSRERYLEINTFLESVRRRKERRWLYPLWRGVRDLSRDVLMKTVFEDKFVLPCVAGRKLLVISETGEVLPCEILGKSMGNLRDYDFSLPELLKQAENRNLVNWIVDSKCKCSFECALAANVVWNVKAYPALVVRTIKNVGRNSL